MIDFSNYFNEIPINCEDFVGFSFCGVHSSQLNIKRVSGGDRFEENLFPESDDLTNEIQKGDGLYYWQTNFKQKEFNISFAYDSITEINLRKIKQVFSPKNYGALYFDETPYKYYMAKPTGEINLKYICFDESNDITSPEQNYERVYKGEGSITFTCYFPYAISRFKYLSEYTNSSFLNNDSTDNVNEWFASSGMLSTQGEYDKTSSKSIKIYNPGDLETDFIAYYSSSTNKIELKSISCNNKVLFFNDGFTLVNGDKGIRINSKTQLIEGIGDNNIPTKNIYNKFITFGDFFKIPVTTDGSIFFTSTDKSCDKLEYNYLYY